VNGGKEERGERIIAKADGCGSKVLLVSVSVTHFHTESQLIFVEFSFPPCDHYY
jgi:hypothetical protein